MNLSLEVIRVARKKQVFCVTSEPKIQGIDGLMIFVSAQSIFDSITKVPIEGGKLCRVEYITPVEEVALKVNFDCRLLDFIQRLQIGEQVICRYSLESGATQIRRISLAEILE